MRVKITDGEKEAMGHITRRRQHYIIRKMELQKDWYEKNTFLPIVRFKGPSNRGEASSEFDEVVLPWLFSSETKYKGNTRCLYRCQVPLMLAWSLTVHKSQGQTLTSALIDPTGWLNTPGIAYVALSRVKSLGGLFLTDSIEPDYVKVEKIVQRFGINNYNENIIGTHEVPFWDQDKYGPNNLLRRRRAMLQRRRMVKPPACSNCDAEMVLKQNKSPSAYGFKRWFYLCTSGNDCYNKGGTKSIWCMNTKGMSE